MYRYALLASSHQEQEKNLNRLFGSHEWKYCLDIDDAKEKEEQLINLFKEKLKARYTINVPFLMKNNATKYHLVHASNNKKALEKMKSAIWNTLPSNTFKISEKDKVGQLKLIEADLNLKNLEIWLWDNFQNKTVKINDIYSKLYDVIYRKKHLHDIIRIYRNNNIVECSDYEGSFAFSKNPTIKFINQKVLINY
ncbi:MAG: hypothetical protein BHK79_02855 [Halanaerobium sp. MDAL1]|nr:MAG: hypothetical protein BHK79_02855 [Halanaerobium sp. MDAL1]